MKNFGYTCITREATCFEFERGKQLKCLIADFRTVFTLKRNQNIEINRNNFRGLIILI